MERMMVSGQTLSPEQAAFAAQVGAGSRDVLASAVEGRVFVYVEEAHRTIRYELDREGFVIHGEVFGREPRHQPLESNCVSTSDDGRAS